MKPRHKRLALIGLGLCGLGVAAALVLNAFQNSLVFFFSPTEVAEKKAPVQKTFRVGGLVAQGSLSEDGVFHANEVLAKHDENYMPPEAADALKPNQEHLKHAGETVAK